MSWPQSDTTPPWFVITGGPSVGKTSLIKEIEQRGYKVIHEAARDVIDQAAKNGISAKELRKDEQRFQEIVTERKIETESSLDKNQVVFLDRGMHDTIAYLQYYNFDIADWIYEAVKNSHYKKVFMLEPLSLYTSDYARVEDQSFVDKIDDLLYRAYSENNLKPELIPRLPVNQRADLVLSLAKIN